MAKPVPLPKNLEGKIRKEFKSAASDEGWQWVVEDKCAFATIELDPIIWAEHSDFEAFDMLFDDLASTYERYFQRVETEIECPACAVDGACAYLIVRFTRESQFDAKF